MPRIYTSANDPTDFCRFCFPTEQQAERKYENLGDGPDGRGNCYAYDAEHPPYDDGDVYRCTTCRRLLGDADDAIANPNDAESARRDRPSPWLGGRR